MNNIIPIPFHIDQSKEKMSYQDGMTIGYTESSLTKIAENFSNELLKRTGIRCHHNGSVFDSTILLQLKRDEIFESVPIPVGISPSSIWVDERYSIEISNSQTKIKSASIEGLSYGLTTLLQLLATTPINSYDNSIQISEMTIIDGPRFLWRSFTLDVAKTYFSIDEIKKLIDLLALYKFNVLTLHLTDNHHWRIQPGRTNDQLALNEKDRFYSNNELSDLVRYADEKFVIVIPEIDGPGYSTALMKLRPELVSEHNSNASWLDPILPLTLPLIKEVFLEMSSIFYTSKYMNIGGDCPAGMPENLYIAFVQELKSFIRTIGKETMGWQNSIRAGIDPHHLIQYWKSNSSETKNDVKKAIENSVPIIITPVAHTYLDIPYAENSIDPSQEEKRNRIGMRAFPAKTVEKSFDWDPANALGNQADEENLAGVGSTIWEESISSFDDLCFLLLPRLVGISEKAWSVPQNSDWESYRLRLAYHKQLWQQDKLDYFHSSNIDWAYADEQYYSIHSNL